jgi:hypothetical protein
VRYFGDASGDLRGLRDQNCQVYVVSVVRGEVHECRRCAKRTVQQVENVPEAKWNNLREVQKRRAFDILAESDLDFGIAKITWVELHQLDDAYLLHEGRFRRDWDIALEARAYAEIVSMLGTESTQIDFTFDRVASASQSDDIVEWIKQINPQIFPDFTGSRQEHGIQTADCLAGAVAEDHKRGTTWVDKISDDRIAICDETVLSNFQLQLHTYESDP